MALGDRKESRAEVSLARHWQGPAVQSHKSLVQWEDGLGGKVLVTLARRPKFNSHPVSILKIALVIDICS